ncbi:MAG: hypothetical protein K2J31_03530 [Alistipes sp.]|nr:hypothetical protein [Alistipes sp.]
MKNFSNFQTEAYNYLEAVTADVLDYIKDNDILVTAENREEIEEQLNDDLWTCDRVTGNGSGSHLLCMTDCIKKNSGYFRRAPYGERFIARPKPMQSEGF